MYTVCDKNYVEDEFHLYLYVRCKYQINLSSVCVCVYQCGDPHASFWTFKSYRSFQMALLLISPIIYRQFIKTLTHVGLQTH